MKGNESEKAYEEKITDESRKNRHQEVRETETRKK